MNYEIGSRVGDYEILEILGAGGMGRVYKVRNVLSDRVEAMKVLLPDLEGNPGLADRFMREIKVQASLDHPNIAALHTALRIENQLMMLMEYVEGVTLDKMMEAGRVPIDKAVDYMAQVLSALSYAHGHGVVHRDLKPANMMVTAAGVVKLMDFGIAKMTADRKLTQTGSTVGSLYYMSPEQIKGAIDLDPRSDLYSLGVSLYEVVTGARPFQGDSEYSIMAAHLEKNPPPPIQVSPNLPAGLNEVILQALEKDPAMRFQTADAFRNALLYACKPAQAAAPAAAAAPSAATVKSQPAIPPPAAAPLPPPPPPATQSGSSHRGLWIGVGALVVLAVIVVVAMQLPKFRKSAAENAPAEPVAATSQVATPSPEPSPATPATETPVPATPEPVQQTQPVAPVASAPPRAQNASRYVVQPRSAARPASATSGAANEAPSTSSALPVSSNPPVSAPAKYVAPPSASPAPSAPSEDAASAAELKEVRNQLNLLSIRMDTVKSSLDTLRRRQAASDLGLRSDMVNASQRMEHFYTLTESAIKSRDADAAKKNLDLAEREVSKLENFLGK
jgi:eukaryotic-like serine/threonine-protein kinase